MPQYLPGEPTPWGRLPWTLRTPGAGVRGEPIPFGVGGVVARAAIPIEPGCPNRYCYDIEIPIVTRTGERIYRTYFSFGTDTQIVGSAQLQSVVDQVLNDLIANAERVGSPPELADVRRQEHYIQYVRFVSITRRE